MSSRTVTQMGRSCGCSRPAWSYGSADGAPWTRTPVFAVRGRGSGSKYSGGVKHSDVARRSRVLSHWPSSPNRTCDAPAGVVERGHAVAVGARAASDAAGGVVETANVLGLGGRERGKRGQCDGDDSHIG